MAGEWEMAGTEEGEGAGNVVSGMGHRVEYNLEWDVQGRDE